jgi:hypothetical protein
MVVMMKSTLKKFRLFFTLLYPFFFFVGCNSFPVINITETPVRTQTSLAFITSTGTVVTSEQPMGSLTPTPTPFSVSLKEIALVIIRGKGIVHASPGSIIACGSQAWRYEDDRLVEVPWSVYENALNSKNRNHWPPYTITFSVSPLSDDKTVQVDVRTYYSRGITERSRGGEDSVWKLKYQEGQWQVIDTKRTLVWD